MGWLDRLASLAAPRKVKTRRSIVQTAAETVAATAALGAAGLFAYWLRERAYASAQYETLREDGPFSVRRYAPIVVAQTDADGSLHNALDSGFRGLFGYISGKRRAAGHGDRAIAMTTPVVAVPGDHSGSWTIRFGMPAGNAPGSLPRPDKDIAIEQLAGRVIAAIRFSGRETDTAMTVERREDLLTWVRTQGLLPLGQPEFATYNAPIIPGPARRNEWWVELASPVAA